MTRLVVLLAALLAAAAAVQGSQATFTASATNAGSSFATHSNFPPVLTLTAPTSGATTNGLPTLSGAAGNSTGDSNTVNVKIYNGTGTGGTVAQSKAVTRSGATWTWTLTTALATGTYTAQATQSDGVNTTTTAALTFTVDATKPTATSVVAANKTGGTAGKIENGDAMTFSYSEAITAASVWSGWNGTSTSVNVRFTNSGNADTVTILSPTTGTINLGSVATNGNYVSATTTFTSTMARSANGASIVVTLGTPASVQATAVTAKNMAWTVGAGITDLAGNAIATPASVTESVSTVDF
jgi:hypothetical protein